MARTTKNNQKKSDNGANGEAQGVSGEVFDEKTQRVTATRRQQQVEAAKLNAATCVRRGFGRQVAANLNGLGYGA